MKKTSDARETINTKTAREHHIIHIAAELPNKNDSIHKARKEILKWAQKRSSGIFPEEAAIGKSFELLAGGRSSAAVNVNLDSINAWALRQEDPDKTVSGRVWTSEAILWRIDGHAPRFATRLVVASSETELAISPAVPGYVLQIAEKFALRIAGQSVTTQPLQIDEDEAFEDFSELLTEPSRRLPIIAFSQSHDNVIRIDLNKISKSLCGIAHVAVVNEASSRKFAERFGRKLSVFDGAVRIYMPGFQEEDSQYNHPLWLGIRMDSPKDIALTERQIRRHVAQFSIRSLRIGADILPFAQLRSISRKAEQDRLATNGASANEQLEAAKARISALEKELQEAKDMEDLALEEERKSRFRAEEAERREFNSTSHIQRLLEKLRDNGEDIRSNNDTPISWDEVEDWCDQALVGRVVLTASARRGCKKALFSNVPQAVRSLLWLSNICRDRFLLGGGSLRDEPLEEGIRNAYCGGDKYEFDWQSRKLIAEWHKKNGGNTRIPENCLRIYYAWDEITQQIIISDMPAHKRTGAT